MKICFMGSMNFAVTILEGLHQKYGVDLVVTQPDKPFGRKQVLKGTPVKEKAEELGIEIFQPVAIRKDNNRILSDDFDFIIVAAYGQIIPEKILYHGKYQAINVHASLLPKYRGGSPMHQAIINGDEITGVSIMYMEKSLDTGPILDQQDISISRTENVQSLEEKLAVLGRDLLLNVIDRLLNIKIQPFKQNDELASYARNIKKDQQIIYFDQRAEQIYNLVRGLYPWPVAYFYIDGLKLKVFQTEILPEDLSDQAGEIVRADKTGLYVQTTEGVIVLKKVQLEGKVAMDINAFMNGAGKQYFSVGQILKESLLNIDNML